MVGILYDRTEEEEFVSFEPALKEYRIPKFRRTNQNMTIDLRPICNKGQRVKAGDILTEGYATENGELALGRNLLVAYIPWKGYNYEDAVVISERMVREDVLTSVHVDEYLSKSTHLLRRKDLRCQALLIRRTLWKHYLKSKYPYRIPLLLNFWKPIRQRSYRAGIVIRRAKPVRGQCQPLSAQE